MCRRRNARAVAAWIVSAVLTFAIPAGAQNERFTIDVRGAALTDVIGLLAVRSGRNLVADGSIRAQHVTLRLHDVTFDEALGAIIAAYNLQVHRDGGILLVGEGTSMSRRYSGDGAAGSPQTRVFVLRYAKPEDAAASLRAGLPEGVIVIGDKRTGSLIVSGSAGAVARAATLVAAVDRRAVGTGLAPRSVALRHARASELLKTLRTALPDANVLPDDRRNALVVTGNDETYEQVRALAAGLDAPGPQVMFEVRVADVQPVNDSENVGMLFGGAGFGSGALGQVPYALTKGISAVNAQLNALIARGKASILAQPRIATLNNKEATLLVGEQYPVVTVNQQTGFPSVQTIDIGVRLRVTPTIGDDGSIVAELHPEYSQIIGFNASFPIVANRKVDATLRVDDGETIVLGGLFQDVDAQTITKLPILGDVPIFGAFFRNRMHTHTRDEVVFFITPHVLPGLPGGR